MVGFRGYRCYSGYWGGILSGLYKDLKGVAQIRRTMEEGYIRYKVKERVLRVVGSGLLKMRGTITLNPEPYTLNTNSKESFPDDMGGCQSYGPLLDPYYNTAPHINLGYPKRDHNFDNQPYNPY